MKNEIKKKWINDAMKEGMMEWMKGRMKKGMDEGRNEKLIGWLTE